MLSSDELLGDILEQSSKLREAILSGELEEAVRLEQDRAALIKRCFSSSSPFENPQQAAESIQIIIDCDQEAMTHGQQLTTELKEEQARLQQGHKALRAYQDVVVN